MVEGRRKPAEEEIAVVPKYEQDLEDSLRNDSEISFESSPWEISDSEGLDDIAPQKVQKTPLVGGYIRQID